MLNGTQAYLAPDAFGSRKFRDKMDIYSLGVCLYAMVCHSLPFTEANFHCPAYKNFKRNGVSTLPFSSGVSKEFKELIG